MHRNAAFFCFAELLVNLISEIAKTMIYRRDLTF